MDREEGKLLVLIKFIQTFSMWNVHTSYMWSAVHTYICNIQCADLFSQTHPIYC
jgi:hypothetical protein